MAKRATLADVAQLAGLSTTTVSMVLNDRPNTRLSKDAADRVRSAAAKLNYRPNPAARGLRLGKTRTVGFISDEVTITRYASAMIRGLLEEAEARDHTVLISESGRRADRIASALDLMLDRQADGIVFGLMGAKQIDVPVLPDLPVVIANATSTPGHPCVLPDEYRAGYEAAKYLLDRGHRRIGFIGRSEALLDPAISATIGSRYAGLDAAMAEAGLSFAHQVDGRYWEPDFGYAGRPGDPGPGGRDRDRQRQRPGGSRRLPGRPGAWPAHPRRPLGDLLRRRVPGLLPAAASSPPCRSRTWRSDARPCSCCSTATRPTGPWCRCRSRSGRRCGTCGERCRGADRAAARGGRPVPSSRSRPRSTPGWRDGSARSSLRP